MSYEAGAVLAGGRRPFHQQRHVVFGSLKRRASNCAAVEGLQQLHSLFSVHQGSNLWPSEGSCVAIKHKFERVVGKNT